MEIDNFSDIIHTYVYLLPDTVVRTRTFFYLGEIGSM